MNGNGPELRDIHLPPAAWWPPAPGWWIVAALALVVVAVGAWLLWRHARRRLLRDALREVDALAAAYEREGDLARLADGASRLVRRVARVLEPGVVGQSGDAWRAFLQRYASDAPTRGALDSLVDARFAPRPALDAAALLAALRVWCGNALRGGAPGESPAPGIRSPPVPKHATVPGPRTEDAVS